MAQNKSKLILIYNADAGLLNALGDSFHKLFSPSTYPCALCALAFGFFGPLPEWRDFLATIPLDKVELHRDDYRERLPDLKADLPVILLEDDAGGLVVVASAAEMEAMEKLDSLIDLTRSRLREAGVAAP